MTNDFNTYSIQFQEHLKSLNLSPKTIKARSYALNEFSKFIGNKRVQDITENDITSYASKMSELSDNTQHIRMTGLKLFFQWLEKSFIIFTNPMSDIKIKSAARLKPRTLKPEKINTIIESIDTTNTKGIRNRAFLEILYSTGARRTEALNLKISDLDLVQSLITLNGKGSKQRVVPVGRTALEWLRKYLKVRPKVDSDDLWLNYQNSKMSEQVMEDLFKQIRSDTGLECTSHTLRRSCATHLLQNGMHPSLISELLGHSSLASLKSYLDVEIEELKETQSLLEVDLWNQL